MKKILLPLCLGAALLTCCTKSNGPKKTASATGGLNGFWTGNFDGSVSESQLFSADGTTVEYDFYGASDATDTANCPYKAYGTYTLSGDTIRFNINFPTLNEQFSEIGTFDTTAAPFTMSGTFTSPEAASGTFAFTKQ